MSTYLLEINLAERAITFNSLIQQEGFARVLDDPSVPLHVRRSLEIGRKSIMKGRRSPISTP
jgi:hypothetical protein